MINKIKIVAIGKIKEVYIRDGISEYLKRLNPHCKFEIIEIKDHGLEKEGKSLSQFLSPSTYVLDAKGKEYSSEDFATLLNEQKETITFIIGGPEGISKNIKEKTKTLSLSKMTFLHEMTRLILFEQIYRGFMILNKSKYHK